MSLNSIWSITFPWLPITCTLIIDKNLWLGLITNENLITTSGWNKMGKSGVIFQIIFNNFSCQAWMEIVY